MTGTLDRLNPRRVLANPLLFRASQWLVRGEGQFRRMVECHLRVEENDRVLDIGCGTAPVLAHLPPIQYVGLDESATYIAAAARRFGARGTFLCRSVDEAAVEDLGPASFDLVIAYGLVHHLDDVQARKFFTLAHAALEPGGRLVTFDGCYADGQSRIMRYLLSKDRGRFVRDRDAYLALAHVVFSDVRADLRSDLLRIPYPLLVMECRR